MIGRKTKRAATAFRRRGHCVAAFRRTGANNFGAPPRDALQHRGTLAIWSARPGAWGRSSAGRALQSHCRGQGFDSPRLHHYQVRRPPRGGVVVSGGGDDLVISPYGLRLASQPDMGDGCPRKLRRSEGGRGDDWPSSLVIVAVGPKAGRVEAVATPPAAIPAWTRLRKGRWRVLPLRHSRWKGRSPSILRREWHRWHC